MGQPSEAPLFRVLARKWRPVDKRERRNAPFRLALPSGEALVTTRNSFGPKKKKLVFTLAEAAKKSARIWNPWMHTK